MLYFTFLVMLSLASTHAVGIRKLYEWPETSAATGPENISIRPCGELVITSTSDPCVYTMNPREQSPERQTIHCFENATATAGIAEIYPDIFAINVGSANGVVGVVGSWGIWTVNFNTRNSPAITKLATISEAYLLNGMTAVPGHQDVLSVDSGLGVVWKTSTISGHYTLAGNDTAFKPSSTLPIGVNGIHIDPLAQNLYFANSANQTFGTAPYDALTGTTVGFQVIATSDNGTFFDDFAIDWMSRLAYVTEHANRIVSIDLQTGQKEVVVDPQDSGVGPFQPTSVVFAPGYCVLYMTTKQNSSQIIEIQLCSRQ